MTTISYSNHLRGRCLASLSILLLVQVSFHDAFTIISSSSQYRSTTPTSSSSLFSSPPPVDPAEPDSLVERQKSTSNSISDDEGDFLKHQKEVFDEMSSVFASGELVTDELKPVYKYLVSSIVKKTIQSTSTSTTITEKEEEKKDHRIKILDVACGAGCLSPFLLESANEMNVDLDIVGVDLSTEMTKLAESRNSDLLSKYNSIEERQHTIQAIESDIMRYSSEEKYDGIIINASFGNLLNQQAILEHLSNLLNVGGNIFISHPLGAKFVRKLHNESPETVPNLLPESTEALSLMTLCLPLEVDEFQTMYKNSNDDIPFYLASLKRVRHQTLENIIRLRGEVAEGYGRGGKKLGFPTANLPSHLFQDALQDVSPGVYFGYAVLEDLSVEEKKKRGGRNVPHKAVVNVGYSPTFEGQENPEKIVEAHLIFPATEEEDNDSSSSSVLDPEDFYGETMRLQLHAYLRPEMKFPSFPALVQQIGADKTDSNVALDTKPYNELRNDYFLIQNSKQSTDTVWIGKSGGDEKASWEFENMEIALSSLLET